MRRPIRLILATAVLAMATAACGQAQEPAAGADPAASAGPVGPIAQDDAAFHEGQLKYAKCMRDNGVDMPDPEPSGAMMMPEPGPETDKAKKACEKLRLAHPDAADPEAMYQRQVAMTKCMREKGIEIDDPKRGQGMAISAGGEKMLKAAQECAAKVRQ
ncbi:hypothetical protein [Streptosporangium sp. KLBMP 9127]|nr:hypothetical protein [Streptosporangium sp. KLBMP 9127]